MKRLAIILIATLLAVLLVPNLSVYARKSAPKNKMLSFKGTITDRSGRVIDVEVQRGKRRYVGKNLSFIVGSHTKIRKNGKKSLSALREGDEVLVRSIGKRLSYFKAKKIVVLHERRKAHVFKGPITDVADDSVEIKVEKSNRQIDAASLRFLVDERTKIIKQGRKTLADLELGDYVLVKSRKLEDSSFRAEKIIVLGEDEEREDEPEYDHVFKGTLASLGEKAIYVTVEDGEGCMKGAVGLTIEVLVNDETEVIVNDEKALLSDLVIGDKVLVLAKYRFKTGGSGELLAKKIIKKSEDGKIEPEPEPAPGEEI